MDLELIRVGTSVTVTDDGVPLGTEAEGGIQDILRDAALAKVLAILAGAA
ncbi:MAG TPA: hypothetical protein VES19_05770 [Candidatus Limnocylindrales bacterium]|nr:hypothetical protein [Candidatus Limnocylindrales bacterium]